MKSTKEEIAQIERRIEKCRSAIEEFSILQEQLQEAQVGPRTADMVKLIAETKQTVEKSLDLLERHLKLESDR